MATEDWQAGGFGLYLHWPFCQAKCPYCDFNSHVVAEIDQARWKRAYIREIDRLADLLPGRVLRSVYFGGGTPSLMEADLVAAVIERIHTRFTTANDIEITLEANPTSVEAGRFRAYREGGVNRVSLGVQALNDRDLKLLGRLHSVKAARAAVELARETFDRITFDLIYARQHQSPQDWRQELHEALQMAADHMSLYQLTIEPGTAFGDRFARGGLPGLPDEDRAADMYFITQELCEAAGLPAYEISNHARPGAQSRHNLIYWQGGDYAGIGPGAHGRLTLGGQRRATTTALAPLVWLRQVETTGNGDLDTAAITPLEQGGEYLMMGLRLRAGLDLERLMAMTPVNMNKIKELSNMGFLEIDGSTLRATDQGRPVLNGILRDLLPEA